MPQILFILFVAPLIIRLLMAIYMPDRLKEQEGKRARTMLTQFGRIYKDPKVDRIGKQLIGSQSIKADFFVLDTPMINAVALPNGDIFIWRGLLGEVAEDDDALAAILAHELGHVVNEHFLRSIYWTALIQFVFGYFARPLGVIGRNIFSKIVHSGYSRFRERQADDTAYELICAAGYSPTGMIKLFEKLARIPNPMGILGSHPEPGKRADRVRILMGVQKEPEMVIEEDIPANVIIFPKERP